MIIQKPISVYVHWPFCEKKCPYCDFNSHISSEIDHIKWEKALIRELQYCIETFLDERNGKRWLKSIFFGGGTPSLMPPKTAESFINFCKDYFGEPPNNEETEITIEANPNSLLEKNLYDFSSAGINRISIGVQSFSDKDLKFLGRLHSSKEAIKSIEMSMKVFQRVSFDLIYALPGQSLNSWEDSLNHALSYSTGHLSLYQLTIEPGTAFNRDFLKGLIKLPNDNIASILYKKTSELTQLSGVPSYEVSNYSKPGEECQHNLVYWSGGDWLGIGPGANGRISTPNGDRIQVEMRKDPNSWLNDVFKKHNGINKVSNESKKDHEIEKVMMGLRLTKGLSIKDIKKIINLTEMKKLIDANYLDLSKGILKTTMNGRLNLNSVLSCLVI